MGQSAGNRPVLGSRNTSTAARSGPSLFPSLLTPFAVRSSLARVAERPEL